MTATGARVVLLASLGGALEFYDFVIFGIFAKGKGDAVLPNPTPFISLMVSFAAFAAGYLARSFGGIVLSHFTRSTGLPLYGSSPGLPPIVRAARRRQPRQR